MKKTILAAAGLAVALFTGCVVTSIYPFYFEKDIAFEPALLGTWAKAGQTNEQWKFERDKANGYRVTVTTDGKPTVEQGYFFKLQGQMFLDLCARESKEEIQPEPVPSHLLARVDQLKPTLKLSALDYGWLEKLLAENPSALRHLLVPTGDNPTDRRLVLTADTTELQQFVIKHLKTKDAWIDPLELLPAAAGSPSR